MTAFDFRRSRGELAEEAWGPLQRALHRWVLAHGGSPLLARTAAWASLADAHADAALPLRGESAGLHGAPMLSEAELEALRGQPMVGDASDGAGMDLAPTAFVIDDRARFYLWRNHVREGRIARRIRQLRAQPGLSAGPAAELDIDHLFDAATGDDNAQRAAVRQLPDRGFAVLTGGPGTGKTTTVLRMLLMAQRQREQAGLPPARIAIAATTGKAAQRLLGSLRSGQQALHARFAEAGEPDWLRLLDRLPAGEAQTLHRLLGYRPHDGRFGRNRDLPLDADIVVVDEASMLDLSLLDALLDALPDTPARRPQLLLVGDADQLTSIGTGSVLLDLVAAMDGSADLVRLEHGFRAQSPRLPELLAAVRMGDAAGVAGAIDGDTVAWQQVTTTRHLHERLRGWAARLAGLAPLRDGRAAGAGEALTALDALASLQLLCALREGEFGALQANSLVERELVRHWRRPVGATWYPGRAVMVVRNDNGTGLRNGDVGVCLADADGGLRVWFEGAGGADGRRDARAFAPGSVPDHEGAFAVTVHKSQGSEYDLVAVLLPPAEQHRALSRQLLYTGLSRARRGVEVWGDPTALAEALATPINRVGGLRERVVA